MVKSFIRVISVVFCLGAFIFWYVSGNDILIFTSAAFLLTFLGTFIPSSKADEPDALKRNTIKQKSGAFSKNTQTVTINEPAGREKS